MPSKSEKPIENLKTYTAQEVMDILQISRNTLYRALKDGRITGVKLGKTWRFSESELRRILDPKPGAGTKVATRAPRTKKKSEE